MQREICSCGREIWSVTGSAVAVFGRKIDDAGSGKKKIKNRGVLAGDWCVWQWMGDKADSRRDWGCGGSWRRARAPKKAVSVGR